MIVTYALTGSPRRVTPSGNETSSYSVRSTSGRRSTAGGRPLDQHRQPPDGLRADDDVGDAGRPLEQRLAFLLRHAAGDRDDRIVTLFGASCRSSPSRV